MEHVDTLFGLRILIVSAEGGRTYSYNSALFKPQWLPPVSTFTKSAFCPQSVLCGSQNKQRLFPYTALTDWFV